MKRDMGELPIDPNGNGERRRTIEFDVADAPMLLHAMIIAGNTAMMCGGGKSENRLHYYRRLFEEVCPPGYQHLSREEHLSDIAIAMTAATTWSIHRSKKYRSSNDGISIITVGNKIWKTHHLERKQHHELEACIASIAPLNCAQVPREDETENQW